MTRSEQNRSLETARAARTDLLIMLLVTAIAAHAQTFAVLHRFTGGADGAYPGNLTITRAGNLYGAASAGGQGDCGGWNSVTLHSFDGQDGSAPVGSVILDGKGNVYGSTANGGSDGNHGVAFQIKL